VKIEAELKQRDGAFVELQDLEGRQLVLRKKLEGAKAKSGESESKLHSHWHRIMPVICTTVVVVPYWQCSLALATTFK
jgi:hypothetical protein